MAADAPLPRLPTFSPAVLYRARIVSFWTKAAVAAAMAAPTGWCKEELYLRLVRSYV